MNNSIIAFNNLEKDEEKIESLKDHQAKFSRIVEAISQVESNQSWKNLKKIYLDEIVKNLKRQLSLEAGRRELNAPEIYRLQGQLLWAKRYVDLKKLAESFMLQIDNLKKQIYDQKNPRDGAL